MSSLIQHNIELQPLNTLKVKSTARGLAQVRSTTELDTVLTEFQQPNWQGAPLFVLGGGSNVVFVNHYPGLIIQPQWSQVEVIDTTADKVIVRVGAGHNWHQLVQWHLREGLSGLENLALIPGNTGGAPIQNIGAYGVEFADLCLAVGIYDLQSGKSKELPTTKCQFDYRHSIFKTPVARHWLVSHVVIALNRTVQPVITYPGLQQQLEETGIQQPSATDIASAVISLRQEKLPDPAITGNAGSFFKNPVISSEQAEPLLSAHNSIPYWQHSNGIKLSAAWLIEQCGWKGKHTANAGVSADHALILINTGTSSGADIIRLATTIQADVMENFAVSLEIEPQVITGTDQPDGSTVT